MDTYERPKNRKTFPAPLETLERRLLRLHEIEETARKEDQLAKEFLEYILENIPTDDAWTIISPEVIKKAWNMLYALEKLGFLESYYKPHNLEDLNEILDGTGFPTRDAKISFEVIIEITREALSDLEGSNWSPIVRAWCEICENNRIITSSDVDVGGSSNKGKGSSGLNASVESEKVINPEVDLKNVLKFCQVMLWWIEDPGTMKREWTEKKKKVRRKKKI